MLAPAICPNFLSGASAHELVFLDLLSTLKFLVQEENFEWIRLFIAIEFRGRCRCYFYCLLKYLGGFNSQTMTAHPLSDASL